MPTKEQACQAWVGLFRNLGVSAVPEFSALAELCTEDVLFRDPFNEVRGHSALRQLLAHTKNSVKQLEFIIHDCAWSDNKAYVKCSMKGHIKIVGFWQVDGVSEVCFAADGRVASHIDHWDAAGQFYNRLPIVGWLLRRLGSKSPPGERAR